ncbi:MAG: 50S ribosomal protein P1 [Candidatus Heimdallarchaeota archaeon]|nr:50S ribosomal protein P1 [Candidatus Heimdallarchaeota archaeon]
MMYLYAALLLHKAEQEITVDAVKKVLKAAGVDVDDARVKTVVAAMGEIDIEEAIASAASMAVAAPAAAGAAPAAAAEEEEEEEEEDEEEGEVVDDDDGLGALFG